MPRWGPRAVVLGALAGFEAACSLFIPLDDLDTEASEGSVESGPGDAPLSEASTNDAGGGTDATPADGSAACDGGGDPDLIGYWPLDETSGTTASDCSGRGHHGLVISIPDGGGWTNGLFGGGYRPDGERGCIDLGSHADFALESGSFTVSVWVKPKTFFKPPNLTRYIVGRSTNATARGWRLGTAPTSRVSIDFGTDAGAMTVSSAEGRPTETWTHAVAVFEADTRVALYLDSARVHELVPTGGIPADPAASLRIGCRDDDRHYFDGVIDEVRIYKRALSAMEIAELAKR